MVQDDIIIDVKNVNYSYGEGDLRRPVLKGVNLTVRKGEIIIMTGPSGSGKTTLLTIIGALRAAQEGSVKVFGQELAGASNDMLTQTRLQTGYIFQQHNLLKSLTAAQNVAMSLELRDGLGERHRRETSVAMLSDVGLGERVDYYPAQLSGGQKQRVSVARALVARPRLVLADEPTASLDKVSGQEAVNILKKLAREQQTAILLVTHDYRILDMADRVVELEDGVIRSAN